ncbi:MAG TPA: hypothetical protein VGW10_18970, partial [Solirubrobacteraceae bacterium]|nr:hypothetical protein [Solirubrobacteraceae bacterium]
MRRADAPIALAVPLWVWWSVWEGGYPVTVWVPGLLYLVAVCVLLWRALPRPPLTGARRWALVAAGLLTAFTALSVLWADDRGLAWTTAARTALYTLSVAIPLVWPPSATAVRGGVLAFAGAALTGLAVALVRAFDDGATLVDGRLTEPTGYPNATAALLIMASFALLPLVVERGRGVAARAGLLGVAGFLAGASLLAQSRGAVAAVAITLLAAVAVGPRRLA